MAYLGNHPIDSLGIDSGNIVDGTIQTIDIANGAVTSSKISGITTSSISEGTNLYYTDTRARAAISVSGSGSYNSSTGVITVTGAVTSVNTLTGAVTLTTSNIGEGTNLYYTDTRARAAISAGTGVTISTGQISIGQAVATGSNVQFNSLGIGTGPSGTTGEIRATNNVTAYYSDDRLKTRLGNISSALDKICGLNGFYYQANETAQKLGYTVKREIGLSAQEVELVFPELIAPAPIDSKYKTLYYEKLIPVLVEAIKELTHRVKLLEK